MKWFGESWGSTICKVETHTSVPNAFCSWCEDKFEAEDQGISIPGITTIHYHLDCFLRTVVGSTGHQRRLCSCYGGNEEDPDGLTKREAAQAAANYFRALNGI